MQRSRSRSAIEGSGPARPSSPHGGVATRVVACGASGVATRVVACRASGVATRVVACGVAVALLAGCGYRERRQRAEQVVAAAGKAVAAGSARGTMTLEYTPKPVAGAPAQGAQFSLPGLSEGRATIGPLDVEVDFASGLARLTRADPGGPVVTQVFRGPAVYMPRTGEFGRRPWVMLDFARLDARKPLAANPAAGFTAFSPSLVVELLAGALSGSVKPTGTETVAGVSVTHYEMNVDWEKAVSQSDVARDQAGLREFSDEALEALDIAYRAMSIANTVYPAEAWLDGDGLPRRVTVAMEQLIRAPGEEGPQAFRGDLLELRMTIEITSYGDALQIEVPEPERTVEVAGFGVLMAETRPRSTRSARSLGEAAGALAPGSGVVSAP